MSTPVAVMVAAGLWVGCLWSAPPWVAGVGVVMLAAAYPMVPAAGTGAHAGGARGAPGPGRSAGAIAVVMIMVAAPLLGAGLAGGRDVLRQRSPLAGLAARGAVADVAARVVTEPRRTALGGWALVRVSRVDDLSVAARAVIHLESEEDVEIGQAVSGRMRVAAPPGDRFGAHLRALGASAALRPVGSVEVGPAPAVLAHTTAIRERSLAAFAAALPADRAALLGGLVLGSRDGFDDDVLRAAGLTHLVVVSGRHVGVLLAGVLTISALFGLGHRGRQRLALLALWWFVVLTRWQPSVLRAALMATLVLVAALTGRGRQPLHSLAVAVIILLLCDPLLSRQAAFALSVLATGGVLVALRPADGRRGRLRAAVRVTLAAQIATAPIALTMADTLALGGVPANLVAAPAATVAQTIGLCAAGVAALQAPGATAIARLAGPPLALVQWAARTFATWPRVTAGHLVVAAALWGCLEAARRWLPVVGPWLRGRSTATVLCVWLAIVLLPSALPAAAPTHLRLVTLDVGQGDALLVEAPDGGRGARMLVDGGPAPEVLDSALRGRRIRRLDALVVTHGDHDHTGGLEWVLRRFDVGVMIVPAGDPTLRDGAPSAREAIQAARRSAVPVVEATAGQRFTLGRARVEVLAPSAWPEPGADRNSRSIVLRVVGAHGSMLLTGDTDETAQLRLLGDRSALRADVLKVPHHGGATNAPGFIDAVAASVAVVSVGADNRYGHPHPDTVVDIAPVPLWRTDRHGTVTVTLTPDGPAVERD